MGYFMVPITNTSPALRHYRCSHCVRAPLSRSPDWPSPLSPHQTTVTRRPPGSTPAPASRRRCRTTRTSRRGPTMSWARCRTAGRSGCTPTEGSSSSITVSRVRKPLNKQTNKRAKDHSHEWRRTDGTGRRTALRNAGPVMVPS